MEYRWTVPERLHEAFADDPSRVPERVTKYLEGEGITVDGVRIKNRDKIETPDGDIEVIEGPFLMIEADQDPTAALDALTLPPKQPDPAMTYLNQYVDAVDGGQTPTNAQVVQAVNALAKIVTNRRE